MNCSSDEPDGADCVWHKWALIASAIHSGLWGVFIMAMPDMSSAVYGFAKTPEDICLWQGAGLFIFLLAIGYSIAATNPPQHWSVVLIGLLAKVLGAVGMCVAVFGQQVSPNVLWLLPVNDIIWWWPFWQIVRNGQSLKIR
jgi:hypothetical protein